MMGAVYNEDEFLNNSILYGPNPWQAMSAPVQVTGQDGGHTTYFGAAGTSTTFYSWDKDCQQ